jgi:transcriptional regulator with XRE-family HTH domain
MTEEKSVIYAKKLKLLRINQFISQKNMAIKFKISQQGYAKLESGKVNFSMKRVEKICKIFKIPITEFITINTKSKKTNSKSTDSYNIKVLKMHYERLLLAKDIRIGKLEIELLHYKPISKPTKKLKEIRVMA